ncbi:hypothetical protein [Nocardioides sp.]|uniref:hypothetical protein n=1 Tax=Nocardioides sp. TaxID=35761 RepID=UPI002D80B82A|nr:hypothetical protein [Nocardioides sp.]HET8961391.1 hypothetical protein [Nocardioides sp.]
MSEHTPGGAAEQLEPNRGERLPRTERGHGRRRRMVAGVGALAVLGASAGAVWAWQSFMGQGAQPAESLPASTLAYVAVDFDPAGGQKLAALGFLRKFPSLEKDAGLTSAGDLRENVFDEVRTDLPCDLGYDDVEPWMGTRFAFAFVDEGGPQPVAVVQVGDRDRAVGGLERLARCADGDLGYALGDQWAVLAESDEVADAVLRDAAGSPLAEDAEFQDWTGRAGEPGVVTLYAAPEAGPALVSAIEDSPYGYITPVGGFDPLGMLMGAFAVAGAADYGSGEAYAMEASSTVRPGRRGGGGHLASEAELDKQLTQLETMTPAEQKAFTRKHFAAAPGPAHQGEVVVDEEEWSQAEFPKPSIPADQRAALMSFAGLGGVVRFDDGALELEVVSDRIEGTTGNLLAGTAGDDVLGDLPTDTAAALNAGFRDGWGEAFVQRFAEASMPFGGQPDRNAAAAFEQQTGLTVADVEALGGDSVAVSVGAGFDPDRLFMDPTRAGVAARISGNADDVEAALEKLAGADRTALEWRRVGDDVLVGANSEYLDRLAGPGGLTGTGRFTHAVPDAADAASVFFLNFDAGDWLDRSVSPSDRPDAEPLAAVGYSLQDEGDRERVVLRVTTED